MTPTPTPKKSPASVTFVRPTSNNVKRDINLMPVNESAAKTTKFLFIAFGSVLGLAILYVVLIFWPSLTLSVIKAKSADMQSQAAALAPVDKEFNDRVAQRNALKDMINSLSLSNSDYLEPADIFSELTATCPDSITLTGVTQSGDGLTLDGVATNDADIAQFIENLKTIKTFTDVILVKSAPPSDTSAVSAQRVFQLKCLLPVPVASAGATPAPTDATQGGTGK